MNKNKFREVILNRKIIISFVIIFIFFLGVAMPKVMNFDSLQDSAQKNYYAGLENAYARQQAHIFFDNPLERMFIMKTAVTDISPDFKRLIVSAYTFFNFKYKTIEIERVPEEAMARMLGRELQQKISRVGEDNDIEQAPKSITKLPKEYFDDNLKLSFEYPNNFYIENDSLGPNFNIVVTPFAPNNPDHDNSEGFIYTSLKMKKVSKSDEYDEIMDDFRDKSQDKEFYPDYQRENTEINGKPAEVIRYNDAFSGGLITSILLDAGDYVLYITYFEDSDYADEYKQITDNIVVEVSIVEELAIKFKSTISSIDISFPGESSLWWNDNDGYSILVPGTESIEIVKDDGAGVQNFVQGGFVRELLDITARVLSTRGFILDESNSSVSGADKRFYDYIQAYKNRDELCVVRVNPDYGSSGCKGNMFMCNTVEITCGNDLVGSQTEQRPFLEALDLQNKEAIVQIRKQIGDYYQISVGHRRTGSGGLAKKEDGGLRLLYTSQEDPFCEIVEKENIPNNVLEGFGINGCWTKEGYRKFSEN